MCGRAVLTTSPKDLREIFALDELPEMPARYNIAPSQPIAIIRQPHRLELLRWGLATGHGGGINVRAESVARAPAYRNAFRHRRCLVVVSGFYEWQHREHQKSRQPYLVRQDDGRPFLLAGIWDQSTTKDGEIVEACAILTGAAKGVVAELHDRMPIVIDPGRIDEWLDPAARDSLGLLTPRGDGLATYPVSTLVNSPANDDPRLLAGLRTRESAKPDRFSGRGAASGSARSAADRRISEACRTWSTSRGSSMRWGSSRGSTEWSRDRA